MRRMKRGLAILLSVLLIFSCIPITSFAGTSFTLSTADATGLSGGTVSIDISLSNNPGIGALTFYVYYDPTLLTYNSRVFGDIWNTHKDITNVNGETNTMSVNATKESLVKYDDGDNVDENIIAVGVLTDKDLATNGILVKLIFNIASVTSLQQTPIKIVCVKSSNNASASTSIPTATLNSTLNIVVPKSIVVSDGLETLAAPTLAQGGSATTAPFIATVYGADGNTETAAVNWSVVDKASGYTTPAVTIGTNGVVTVKSSAPAGTYTVSAVYNDYQIGTKDFIITKESPTVYGVNVSSSTDLTVPKSGEADVTKTLSSNTYDQYGSAIAANVTYSLDDEYKGININGNTLTVTKAAVENTFNGNSLSIKLYASVTGTTIVSFPKSFNLIRETSVASELVLNDGTYGSFIFTNNAATVEVKGANDSDDLSGNIADGFKLKDQYGFDLTITGLTFNIFTDQAGSTPYIGEDIVVKDGVLTVSKAAAEATYLIRATAGGKTRDITLIISRQAAAAKTLALSGTTSVKVQSTTDAYGTYTTAITDQFGNAMKDDQTVNWSVKVKNGNNYEPTSNAVIDSTGKLTVMKGTPSAVYRITAACGAASDSLDLNVTRFYDITTSSAYGTVTTDADNSSARAGDPVNVTVTKAAGYDIVSVLAGAADITSTLNDGKYSFTMPAADIVISVVYKVTNPTLNAPVTPISEKYGVSKNISVAAATAPAGIDYTYQWYSCDSDGSDKVKLDSTYTGYNTAELTVINNLPVNSYYFYCEVTANDNDEATTAGSTFSDIITYTVTKAAALTGITGAKSVYYNETTAKTGEFAFTSFGVLPSGFTGANIKSAVVGSSNDFVTSPVVINNGVGISFTYSSTSLNNSNTIIVTISSDNYEDITATLTITARSVEFGETDFDDVRALVQSSVEYGTTNSQVLKGALPTDVPARVGEEDVTGYFELKSLGTDIQNAGSTSLVIAFVVESKNISLEESIPFTVTQKVLVPSIGTVSSKEYDGNISATGSITLTGAVPGQIPVADGTFTWESANAGTNRIKVENIALGSQWTNYKLSKTSIAYEEVTAQINKKQLSITEPTITKTKTYDGDTSAAVTKGTVSGLFGNEAVTVTATAAYDNKDVGTGKTIVVSYELSDALNGTVAANYIKPDNFTITDGVINALLLEIDPPTVTQSKEYDGNTNAAVTAGALTNLKSVDAGKVMVSAVATYNDKDVAEANKITIEYSIYGDEARNNYIAPATARVSGTITPRKLNVTNTVVTTDKIYDGYRTAKVVVGTPDNLVAGESVTLTATAEYNNSDKGDDKIITVTYFLTETGDWENYETPDAYTVPGTIKAKDATSFTIEEIPSEVYSGTAKKPVLTVKDGGKTLASGTDYTVGYSNNINAGTAIATVTFINNYSGTLTKNFIINRKPISSEVTIGDIAVQPYTGSAIAPAVTVNYTASLIEGKDYDLSYANNTNYGTATVTVTFIGNYSGSVTKDFTIRGLTSIEVTQEPEQTVYYISGDDYFNKTGLKVTAHYSNGDTKVLTLDDISVSYIDGGTNGSSSLDVGDSHVILSYTEGPLTSEVQQPITAVAKVVTKIEASGTYKTTGYSAGDTFDKAGLVITATYNDNDSKAIDTNNIDVIYYANNGSAKTGKAFDATEGNTKVTFSYGGQTCDSLGIDAVNPVVYWVIGNKAPIMDKTYSYGVSPLYTISPPNYPDPASTDPSYTFYGWTAADGTKYVNGAALPGAVGITYYYATYTGAKYTVKFKDFDGTVLNVGGNSSQTVDYGKAATAPANPSRIGYVFTGWKADNQQVYTTLPVMTGASGEYVYTAAYTPTVKKVTYFNDDGSLLYTENVEYGKDAVYGRNPANNPTKPTTAENSYTFDKWVTAIGRTSPADFYTITADTAAYASYSSSKEQYTYTFYDENGSTILKSEKVPYGTVITKPAVNPEKADTAQYDYTFVGYSGFKENETRATGNVSFKAVYSSRVQTYTIKFDVNDNVTEATYKYGETPSYMGSTAKPSGANDIYNYTFSGWSPAITSVSGNATYTAQYTTTERDDLTYQVVFKNHDGSVLSEQTVDKGKAPVAPVALRAADVAYTYVFKGWNDGTKVYPTAGLPLATADATYTADFTQVDRYYTVLFKDDNGKVLTTASQDNRYKANTAASAIQLPATPTKTSVAYEYTFKGWNLADVTADVVYIAEYNTKLKENVLTIIKAYVGGEPVVPSVTVKVEYGKTKELTIEQIQGYTPYINGIKVSGATYTTKPITADTTLTVTYKPNRYYLTTTCKYVDELIKYELISIDYKSTRTVYVPVIEGRMAKLGDYELTDGHAYTVTYNNEWVAVDNGPSASGDIELNVNYTATSDKLVEISYVPREYTITYSVIDVYGNSLDTSLYTLNQDLSLNGGKYTKSYKYGEMITAPTAVYANPNDTTPYMWSGWENLPNEMPANNIEVKGKFTAGQYEYVYLIYDQYGNLIGTGNYYQQRLDVYNPSGSSNPDFPLFGGYQFSPWAPNGIILMSSDSTKITLSSTQTIQSYKLTLSFNVDELNGADISYSIAGEAKTAKVINRTLEISVPYGKTYSVTIPEISGYTANQTVVSGVMDGTSGKTTSVIYTAIPYDVTVNYVYEDGSPADATKTQIVNYNGDYTIPSKDITGYTADKPVVTGKMGTADVIETVTYHPNTYVLTINYYYGSKDGQTAATSVTESLKYGMAYEHKSPDIDGYTASLTIVSGELTEDKTVDVIYTSGEYAIRYLIEGEEPYIVKYNAGDSVIAYVPSAIKGHSFDGWTWSIGTAPDKMPAQDLYATGTYTPNTYKLIVKYVYSGSDTSDVPNDEYYMTFGTELTVTPKAKAGYTVSPDIYKVTMDEEGRTKTFTYTAIPSGGGGGSTPAPTDTIKQTTDTVASNKITEALKAKTGEVNIETSTGKAIITAADAAKIAEGKAELTVKTEAASVSFTAEGLGILTEGVTTGDSLKVEVGKDTNAVSGFKVVTGETVLASVNVSVYTGDTKVTAGFGTLTITIPVGKTYAGKTVSILHVKDDGSYTVLTAVIDADGNAAVNVDSLSSFIAVQKTIKPVADVFTDVKSGDWFEGYAQYVYDQGLMTGNTATTFAPQNTASRAMVVTVLWRMAGSPTGNADAGFKDLNQDWYKEAVNWAYANKITTGKSADEFDPSAPVTREQLASFLYRYSKLKGYDVSIGENTNILSYEDASSVSEYAVAAMQWAKGSGIINGRSAATLVPAGQSTRAELAAMLTRYETTTK